MIVSSIVNYDCFLHKFGVRKKDNKMGNFTPLIQAWISIDNIEQERKFFNDRLDRVKSIDPKAILYNDYCVEWSEGDKVFLDYIIGFVK